MLRFHTQTAGVQLTAQQPEVNLVRVALQGLGAVLGGTQSLHTNSYDEAIALPTAKAARLALRTQQVIAYETDVTKTVDPFAGSYVMESLTDDLEAAILDLMERVEAMGGAVAAIEQGFQKSEIERSAYDVARRSTRASGPWSGSTGSRSTRRSRTSRCGSTRRSRPTSASGSRRCGRERDDGAVDAGPGRLCAPAAKGDATTCCRRCGRRWRPGPPSARSATRCGRSGGPTSHAIPSDHCDHEPSTADPSWQSTADHVRAVVDDLTDALVTVRRDLHAHPELARQEHRTTADPGRAAEPRPGIHVHDPADHRPGRRGRSRCRAGRVGHDDRRAARRPGRAAARRPDDRPLAGHRRRPGPRLRPRRPRRLPARRRPDPAAGCTARPTCPAGSG